MKKIILHTFYALVLSVTTLLSPAAMAETKDSFKICWSIYVGWMPWDYAAYSGKLDKWAKKYDIEIEMVQINDYIESINQYTAGAFDGCTMTNMDALTIPAAGGVDTTALIIGDYSNGNDAVVLKGTDKLADIKGQSVNLVELSVSHYLLARGLDSVGLSERDVKVINTADADLVSAFTTKDVTAVTTWNPLLAEIDNMPKSEVVFDSSDIPGEIIDVMVVNTQTLKDNPKLGKALAGAWYETMQEFTAKNEKALSYMAESSGTDLAGYQAQLDSTNMFFTPSSAVEFTTSDQLVKTMKQVAEFSFDKGLLGEGAADASFIGMSYPGGVTSGEKSNIKLRFDATYMQMAADNSL